MEILVMLLFALFRIIPAPDHGWDTAGIFLYFPAWICTTMTGKTGIFPWFPQLS
jgi:hypothetical protein